MHTLANRNPVLYSQLRICISGSLAVLCNKSSYNFLQRFLLFKNFLFCLQRLKVSKDLVGCEVSLAYLICY